MRKSIQVKVHPDLIDVFGNIGRAFAEKIKKEYGLETLEVPNTLASQIMAAKFKGQKIFNFKVEKNGLNKGRLVFDG